MLFIIYDAINLRSAALVHLQKHDTKQKYAGSLTYLVSSFDYV